MSKVLSTLMITAAVALALPAHAASHAGAAPMAKASEPAKKAADKAAPAAAAKASEPAKKDAAKK